MPSPRILIVDDSQLLRSALCGLLRSAGDYEVLEAESGTQAIPFAEQHRPELIILDFAMPGMDGLGVARILQKQLPQIPILMYTMHYTNQLVANAKLAGVTKLISKSDGGDLVAAVRELIAPTVDPKPDRTEVCEPILGMPTSRS